MKWLLKIAQTWRRKQISRYRKHKVIPNKMNPNRSSPRNTIIKMGKVTENILKPVCCGQLCLTLCDPMDCSPLGSRVHGDSPGKNTGVVSMPSPRGSSQPRDWTQVFYIAGGFFTVWATKEASKRKTVIYKVISQRLISLQKLLRPEWRGMIYSKCLKEKACNLEYSTLHNYHLELKER